MKRLLWAYQTYIRSGNVPITEFPYWMAEVVALARHYEGLGQKKKIDDLTERARTDDLLKQAGVKR